MMLRPLFDDEVLVADTDPRAADVDALYPAELEAITTAVSKRRREFAAGRILARTLLARLGVPADFALRQATDRVPCWPEGIVGSITHTRERVAVAVARSGRIRSVGCDLELDAGLAPEVLARVCDVTERRWVEAQPDEIRPFLSKLFFSAKEAVYKAQYGISGTFLQFYDVRLEIDRTRGTFVARLTRPLDAFGEGHRFHGRFRAVDGHVATAVTILDPELSS